MILHGENMVQSRNTLSSLIDQARSLNKVILRLDAKRLEPKALSEELGATSLFGESRFIIIEEIHSLPTSQRKTQLITLLGSISESTELLLWEKKQLTPTMLKQFPLAKSQEFKLTKYLFQWLDSVQSQSKLSRNRFMLAVEQDGEMMCFTMLIRQLRLLIQATENKTATLPPFMVAKLKKQADTFTLAKLLQLHSSLLRLDLSMKTSTGNLSLTQELELLLIEM